jgi:hypothetical protein
VKDRVVCGLQLIKGTGLAMDIGCGQNPDKCLPGGSDQTAL